LVVAYLFGPPCRPTLFVCVNTGVTENAGMENARMSTMESQSPLIYLQEAYVCACVRACSLSVSSSPRVLFCRYGALF